MPDPRSLLPFAELAKPRTPAELAAWVDETIAAIAEVADARKPALMHQGPFKKFYEEIYPLNLFVKHRYSGREDILVTPNPDNRSFDAVVRDGSVSPPLKVMVEITQAWDPQAHLRMEYFVTHGGVRLWSPVISSGNKRNRNTHVELMAVDREEHVRRECAWIKEAAEGKASRTDHYGPSHVLVIAFDDWWKPSDGDIGELRVFVTEHVLPLPLNFSALYILGMSGRTYLPFSLTSSGGNG
ncbi:MAG: hypothetical protein Q7W02_10750 [Candidatus Rokubacteria bacterium]|nr:hypothetical protein [Candidatus Rokubacteria bacterium]